MCRATSQVHAPAGNLDKEQHVQPTKPDRVDGEEIDGNHALRLRAEELTPRRTLALARWAELVLAENLPDGGRVHDHAKVFQFTDYALIAPTGIFVRQAQNKFSSLELDRRPTAAAVVGPALGDQSPIATEQVWPA
jgi:hypothetical protein